jgi:hypothetical protein
MRILNFGHALTTDQLQKVEEITGISIQCVLDIPLLIDINHPIAPQLEEVIDKLESIFNFQADPYLISCPGLAVASVVLLTLLHGRSGYFPSVIRLAAANSKPQRHEVVEVVNLQVLRDKSRVKRRS